MKECVECKGIINSIDSDKIYVRVIFSSACADCHKKCWVLSSLKEDIIEINKKGSNNYNVYETVKVIMKESLGIKAVLLVYFIPFIILLLFLIILFSITKNEGLSGIISIFTLVPYYIILYIKRDKLKKTFEFQIEKI